MSAVYYIKLEKAGIENEKIFSDKIYDHNCVGLLIISNWLRVMEYKDMFTNDFLVTTKMYLSYNNFIEAFFIQINDSI